MEWHLTVPVQIEPRSNDADDEEFLKPASNSHRISAEGLNHVKKEEIDHEELNVSNGDDDALYSGGISDSKGSQARTSISGKEVKEESNDEDYAGNSSKDAIPVMR